MAPNAVIANLAKTHTEWDLWQYRTPNPDVLRRSRFLDAFCAEACCAAKRSHIPFPTVGVFTAAI